ncbi:unnamed protein product [Brassica rapa subsp. trilocularis]
MAEQESDKNIEIWKIKKLIKGLESARGNGTSMISLIMPPRDQVARVTKMLADEYGTASNIKSRVNRQSVLSAITSAQQRLKLYNKVPPNGLVLYTGTIVTDDGKEKKVTIDFEPFKPINASLYLCDNKFHTEPLNELLESDDKFGFIVMDGNGTLFGTLSGNTREVLHKFTVDLPKKHGRGGQSALRFARLRMEKRHNYVRKTAELATQFYINPATSQPNVSGLILAGSADFKTELSQSELFDPRLQAKILNVVDVSYGGENGFNQAIELSAEILSNVKFIQEKKLIGKYFEEISQDTGKYVFGVDDTLKALDMGAVETLIVWENLDINRYELKNGATGEIVIKHLGKDQENDQSNFHDAESSAELEVVEKMPLLEWFANEYKRFGCTLEFVTNKSQEGSQFCRGFGGIERRSVAMDLSMREARSFKMEELAQATKSFTNKSLIGTGKFGEVYKGLLQDGVLVAIKKRPGLPTQEFVNEVRYLSSINHRNLVTLLGYCQENNTQFLVYEYVPNGSVSSHLYGGGDKVSGNRLEFRNRLAISIGAAKGLAHLHSLSPRLIHKDFKTANVLVDENFIARVADAGVRNFLGRDDVVVGTSSLDAADQIFLSPEVQEFRRFSEKSDVYAFGVFLLELVSGREASEPSPSSSTQTRVEWMQNIRDYTDTPAMIDERLGGTYTAEGVEEVITLTLRCLNVSSEKRPAMSYVLTELERILDKEVSLTTVMGEVELAEDDNSSVSRTLGYYYLLCLDPNTQSYFSYKVTIYGK